ncbi:MAG TPA: methyltransferase domain-containing protein [Actinomycetota bacterium]|nr:methyltransferase domain-containing protein [Actinomycetota bacterium]
MSSRNTSISFDRAADFYDRTRSLTAEAEVAQTTLLVKELEGRSTLEIGVGTGRIALPLHARGIEMIGLDLSVAMMSKLIERAGGSAFPLVRGDALSLPFRDGSVDAVIASWVLHLVADWRVVVGEAMRVLRADGRILVTEGGPICGVNIPNQITRRFREVSGVTGWPRGPVEIGELDAEMARHGATARELPPVSERRTETIEAHIAGLEAGFFSVSWDLTEDQRHAAAEEVRRWARAEFGDLDEPRTIETPHVWKVYDRKPTV